MSCDVICLAMLYVLRCYMSISKHKPQKQKTKNKNKKNKKKEDKTSFFYIYILSLISLFCHSFLGFLYNPIKRRVNNIQIKVRESPGKPGLHSIVSVDYN